MKFNWRILVGLVVLVGAIFWGVDSVRTRSYSGNDLNFGVGSGPVTVTNRSDESLPVQLVGTGNRSFSVSSTSEGALGSSTKQGSGRTTTQLFEFALPAGVTELMIVARGSAVNFVADSSSHLDVTVQPLIESDARMTLIIAVVVALGALFYISRATGHRWIHTLRPQKTSIEDTRPIAVPAAADVNRGRDGRMYSDI